MVMSQDVALRTERAWVFLGQDPALFKTKLYECLLETKHFSPEISSREKGTPGRCPKQTPWEKNRARSISCCIVLINKWA